MLPSSYTGTLFPLAFEGFRFFLDLAADTPPRTETWPRPSLVIEVMVRAMTLFSITTSSLRTAGVPLCILTSDVGFNFTPSPFQSERAPLIPFFTQSFEPFVASFSPPRILPPSLCDATSPRLCSVYLP